MIVFAFEGDSTMTRCRPCPFPSTGGASLVVERARAPAAPRPEEREDAFAFAPALARLAAPRALTIVSRAEGAAPGFFGGAVAAGFFAVAGFFAAASPVPAVAGALAVTSF